MSENTEELENEIVEEINPPEIDSKYRMIILAAQRSKQLQRGAISRTEIDVRKNKPTRVAMREIKEQKVNFKFKAVESVDEPATTTEEKS